MMGKSHLIAGACALEHAWVLGVLADRSNIAVLSETKNTISTYLGYAHPSMAMIPMGIGAYFIGTLLPDIDSPNSILGHRLPRFFSAVAGHRRWLHAIYLYLILAALGMVHPVFLWCFLGVVNHLFWDSFSVMGNCWFYKLLSDYQEYPSGAKVKKGHRWKLYRAGEWSEYLLLFIVVMFTVVSYMLMVR